MRHTHATLLLKAGVPIQVVSERLGHATPAFTMATYQHVLPGMQAEAAETFAELLERLPATPGRRLGGRPPEDGRSPGQQHADRGQWWRREDLNLRPSGYERGTRSPLLPVTPVQYR